MNLLMAAALVPLYFTAPADSLDANRTGRVRVSPDPVHAYVFQRLDPQGRMVVIPGYADSAGSAILTPHAPGTRETVWLAPDGSANGVTIFVLSVDTKGNRSVTSNGCVIGHHPGRAPLAADGAVWTSLDVPLEKQSRERCGQAALSMVLRYYGAPPSALREVDGAYDPVLRGSLITDLAVAARRAGYEAAVATLTPDSLIDLLSDGVPPILLYQRGSGPVTFRHYGVVTGWDAKQAAFTLHDGTARPRVTRRTDLAKRWETAGSQALIVRRRAL